MGSYFITDLVIALMIAQRWQAQVLIGDQEIQFNFVENAPSPADMDVLRKSGFVQDSKIDREWTSCVDFYE